MSFATEDESLCGGRLFAASWCDQTSCCNIVRFGRDASMRLPLPPPSAGEMTVH